MTRKLLTGLVMLLWSTPALAQLGSVPYTFTTGTTISSSQVNTNFSTAYSTALNRTGGTMSGTLTTHALLPEADATYDIGSASFKYRDGYLSRNASIGGTLGVTGAVTLSSTLAVTSAATFSSTVATGALTVTGTATATTFSGSGASLTSIPETAITDGSILARLGADETVTGAWTFPSLAVSAAAPQLKLFQSDGAAGYKNWIFVADATQIDLRLYNDALSTYVIPWTFEASTSVFTVGGSIATATAITAGGTITSTGGNVLADNGTVRGLTVSSLGAVTAATTITAGTGLTVTTGNLVVTAGTISTTASSISAATTITAGSGITATTGNVVATAGNVTAGSNVIATSGLFEHGRSAGVGVAVTPGFSAGRYTGTGGTWTVGSGDVAGESYRLIGDTMIYSLRLVTTTIGASITALNITIPGSFTSTEGSSTVGMVVDAGGAVAYPLLCTAAASGTTVVCSFANGAAFVTGTDNQTVYFQIVLRVS